MREFRTCAATAAVVLFGSAFAQFDPIKVLATEGFTRPPTSVEEAVLAPWNENIDGGLRSPDNRRMIVQVTDTLVPLALLGKSHVILAGDDFDTVAERDRALTTRSARGLQVMELTTKKRWDIRVPSGLRVGPTAWSPDSRSIAFIGIGEKDTFLCVSNPSDGSTRIVASGLRLTGSRTMTWLSDSARIVTTIEPERKGVKPLIDALASGPKVRTSDLKTQGLRTYAGLLETVEQADYLEYLMNSQVAVISISDGSTRRIGPVGMITGVDPASDGTGFLVNTMTRPFSYMVPSSSFPRKEELWNETGKLVTVLSSLGLRVMGEPDKPTPDHAPRAWSWRPDGAGLSFLQLEDRKTGGTEEGEESRQAPRMDRLMLWRAPFAETDKSVVWQSSTRISSLSFGPSAQDMFVTQSISGKTVTNYYDLRVSDPKPVKVQESAAPAATGGRGGRGAGTSDDSFYNNPGSLDRTRGSRGGSTIRMSSDRKFVYFTGTQYFKDPIKEAPRPFVDQYELSTGKKERIWQSSPDFYETMDILDDNFDRGIMTRQSPKDVPQMILVDRKSKQETQITGNVDFLPDLTQATERRLRVKRADGFEFWVKIQVPRFTYSSTRLPAFFWFYPNEVRDQADYDRGLRTFNKNAFRRIRSSSTAILLREGYAVVEPDCPIVGQAEAPNDLYIHQLRNNLSATIDALDREGVIDRTKLAIGGHSYGAFSTANAMIHTPFFKAGIAGAGNYNRSLTPFGFQAEPRQIWGAREIYQDLSALWHADKLTGALLMYHGMQDQNMGTAPINSERMFQALEALGKPAALYMYPYEDHGQVAMETRLDMWARWVAWLERWVKNPDKYEAKPESEPEKVDPPLALSIQLPRNLGETAP